MISIRKIFGIASLSAVAALLGGCWSFSPARGPRQGDPDARPLPSEAWPARSLEAVRPLMNATPDQVFDFRMKPGADASTLPPRVREAIERPSFYVAYKGLHAEGLLRIFDPVFRDEKSERAVRDAADRAEGFLPNASFISSRTLEDESLQREQRESQRIKDHLAHSESWLARPFDNTFMREQTLLTTGRPLYIPPARKGPAYRGVIIHLSAIAGNSFEQRAVAALRARGWYVVDVGTFSVIRPPVPEDDARKAEELEDQAADIYASMIERDPLGIRAGGIRNDPRYPEYRRLLEKASRLREGTFQVCTDEDVPDAAARIAQSVDEGLVSNAYAVEAVLDFLRTQRPDVPKGPVVLVGFSAGALAAPAAAARVLDRLDAIVLIGGGANLLHLSQHSSFTDGGLKVRCGKHEIPRERMKLLEQAYLDRSLLDPYRTAPLLRDKPILQVHASLDGWVPAEGGELLYQRLGHPDRLTLLGGHQLLFYLLPYEADRIERWIARNAGKVRW